MKTDCDQLTRRGFLNSAGRGILGGLAAWQFPGIAVAGPTTSPSGSASIPASLTTGDSRADNVFRALTMIKDHVRKGLARKKRVLIKPNMVVTSRQLAATHVECVEAILEFLQPLYKGEIIIADSPAGGSVTVGYDHYGFYRLQNRYKNLKFIDLDEEPFVIRHAVDHTFRPQPLRMAKFMFDPDLYIISSAIPKTHDRAVVTLSLKNIVVGAAKKDANFTWSRDSKGKNDKQIIHGGRGNAGINYNLFQLAKQLHPDLAVIDGFQGMEHNGPCGGTPVDHRIAIASTDWLAADRIATELMGFDFNKVGYLSFCGRAGMGQANLDQIEVLGERITDHTRQYKPADNIGDQYKWITREAV